MVTGPILTPFEDQRELEEKHQAAAPDAAQLRIIIKKKKKMFTSGEKLLLKQQRENTRFDEIVTQNLGQVVSLAPPAP